MEKRKLQDYNNIEPKIKKFNTFSYESSDSSDDESDQQSLVNNDHKPQKNLEVLSNKEEPTFRSLPIQTELVQKWSEIMVNGLEKEAIPAFIKKYPIPINFQNAFGPLLNPEIAVMQKEKFLKRDYKMRMRQDLTGSLLALIGRILTNIHDGDIDCEKICKQLNDAAMIAAGIHYGDTDCRRKFGVSVLNKAATCAIKDLKPDKYLFGKHCAAALKAAQAEESIGSSAQFPSTSTTATGKNMSRVKNTPPLKRISNTPIKNNVHTSNFQHKGRTSNFPQKFNQKVQKSNFSQNSNYKQNKWGGPRKQFKPCTTWSRIPWQTTDTTPETETPEDTYFPPPWPQL